MPKLICKRVTYYTEHDETAFFEWLSRIRGLRKWECISDEVHISLPTSTISDACLRELTALFYRYKINMQQLQQFVNDKNRHWYEKKTAYWYKGVFGKQKEI